MKKTLGRTGANFSAVRLRWARRRWPELPCSELQPLPPQRAPEMATTAMPAIPADKMTAAPKGPRPRN